MNGLVFALNKGWFDPHNFNIQEYDDQCCYTFGDLNWVIPGEVIAFSGPNDQKMGKYRIFKIQRLIVVGRMVTNTSTKIAGILNKFGVKTVFRLNKNEYDRNNFINAGIEHFDFYYTDGTVPDEVSIQI